MTKQIEFAIPKGYVKSNKSTNEKLVFELVENDVEKEKRDFLINVFNKMNVRIEPDAVGRVYYDVDGKTVFEQNFKCNKLYVSYSIIWNVFESKFSMKYGETQRFIRSMVKYVLNWKGLTPSAQHSAQLLGWKMS